MPPVGSALELTIVLPPDGRRTRLSVSVIPVMCATCCGPEPNSYVRGLSGPHGSAGVLGIKT